MSKIVRMGPRGSISWYLCCAFVIWVIISVSTFRNGVTIDSQSIRKKNNSKQVSSSSDIDSRSNNKDRFTSSEMIQMKYAGWIHPYGNRIEKSLYSGDKYIIESDGLLPKYKSNENRILIVYYASWCGHCRHFANIFKRIASKRSYVHSNIIYLAVDCAHYENECTNKKIRFYPTVKSFGFINKDGSVDNDREMKGKELEVLKYIDTHPYTPLADTSSTTKSTSTSSSMIELKSTIDYRWGNTTVNKIDKIIQAPQSARMIDAMTSVSFMLTREPASENAYLSGKRSDAGKSLEGFLLNVITMIQNFRPEDAIPYQQLVKAIRNEWNKAENSRKSWDALLRELGYEDKTHPHRSYGPCVGLLNYQEIQQEEEERQKVRGQSFKKKGKGLLSVGDNEHKKIMEKEMYYYADRAYTCGLWQLFHALIAFHDLDTFTVMNVIHNFVEYLFGCDGCRTHFLTAWDKCHFGRCDVYEAAMKISLQTSTKSDVEQVRHQAMLWLYDLHNNVTKRIAIDHGYPPQQVETLFTFPSTYYNECRYSKPTSECTLHDQDKIKLLKKLYTWK